MRNTQKKGFTLIELLVVITIIWILATGWVSIFTKQLQGARDATRINDVKLLETAILLHYSDEEVYPDPATFSWAVKGYMSKPVKDPKSAKPVCWRDDSWTIKNDQQCWGIYIRSNDEYWLENSAFKLAIYFEKETNFTNKANNTWKDWDGWTSNSMYELFAWAGAWSGITITESTTIGSLAGVWMTTFADTIAY